MKRYSLLLATVLLLFSCSMDNKPELLPETLDAGDTVVRACFQVSQNSVMAGASLTITNCSEGAKSYLYDFGNGNTSSDDQPTIYYEEAGTYELSLTVSGEGDTSDTFSITIQVIGPNFIYPEIPQGYTANPVDLGLDAHSGELYAITVLKDESGLEGRKFFYHSLGASMMEGAKYLGDQTYDGNNAFSWFLPGGARGFHFSRTLNGFYGSREVSFDGEWNVSGQLNSAEQISYGYLQDNGNLLFYGSIKEGVTNKAAIDMRNGMGDSFKQVLHQVGEHDSHIGSMIKTENGYAAFGGSFIKNDNKPYITEYRPTLIFLDEALEMISYKIFDNSMLTGRIYSTADLNGSFNMLHLPNGNFVLYGLGELLVTDNSGTIIRSHFYENTLNNQGLIGFRDSFVISSDRFLRKFNAMGEQLSALQYPGKQVPAFIAKDEKLYMIAKYATPEGEKLLYGALDQELNVIAWEPG
ncbi:PKD domain-containing protein [Zeaxanthinibacter enoshimensis]|uniref:PKD domain-containing protein n=1 Tax=Zeaxanthinibacter enoshimensis TaxID=392009 RepID=A0A4R6TS55_9FLAO|nr:PKD domain-containing protein [Zeaxanthinibacter enoshimensis]TDQ33416.1 PKD domain-containing protein [Zeaxanthinibacter enoshimensis]